MQHVQSLQLQKTGLVSVTGGYERNYFLDDNVSQDLICGICLSVCKETTQLPCAHIFCHACIGCWFVVNDPHPSCPMCRAQHNGYCDLKLLTPDLVLQLNVRCTNQMCEWRGSLQQRTCHCMDCKFEPKDQTCKRCSFIGSQFALSKHLCFPNTTTCAICANPCGMLCITCEVEPCELSGVLTCTLTKKLSCEHEFHTHCIERWHRIREQCPLC